MQHHAHRVPQAFHGVVLDRPAAHADDALLGLVEPGDELDQGGLGGAGAADDAHGHAAFDVEINVAEVPLLRVAAVLEGHMVKVHGAVGHRQIRRGGPIGDVWDLVQHLRHALGAGNGPGEHHHDHGHHHQAHEHLGDIGEEGGQEAHLQFPGLDQGSAVPHDGDDGAVGDEHHNGHVHYHEPKGPLRDAPQSVVALAEFLLLIVLPDEVICSL